jgi:hypothetical protein
MAGSPVRTAIASALVPTLASSQRPAGTKLTDSAFRRITRPPYVQSTRVSGSVTASTRSPSSAVLRSSSSTRSTAIWSGDPWKYAAVSSSSASGACVTSGVTVASDSSQLRRISGRTSDIPSACSMKDVHARTASSRRDCRSRVSLMSAPDEW